jgi:prevent-host-death family protein
MVTVGIRALKQNASAVVAQAADGEVITITDRGRSVAQLTPIPSTRLEALIAGGRARRPRHSLRQLPEPTPATKSLTSTLAEMRDAERY